MITHQKNCIVFPVQDPLYHTLFAQQVLYALSRHIEMKMAIK